MQIIKQHKLILCMILSTGLFTGACANEASSQDETSAHTSIIKADNNQDGLLTREEFKIFVALEADNGSADYADIQTRNAEDIIFSGKDLDADGLLGADELAYQVQLSTGSGSGDISQPSEDVISLPPKSDISEGGASDIPSYGSDKAPKTTE